MNNERNKYIHQTAKAALITTVALALMLPAGFAAADTVTSVTSITTTAAPGLQGNSAVTPDPASAKITQDEAVAKLLALFPVLKDASVSNVQLTTGNYYPPKADQLVWNIQWNYQIGSSGYGFTSQLDAVTGDLISTYLYFPLVGTDSYYPPKLTEAEALAKARSFVAAAAPSLKSSELVVEEETFMYSNAALFGPVQYPFSFRLQVNGLPSASDFIRVTVDGSGNIIQFNKQFFNQEYPSAKPAVSGEQAGKVFSDNLKVGLYYTPVYKKGQVDSWVLGWRPQDEALYRIDAQTGKRLDAEGNDATTPVVYEAITAGKDVFQPVAGSKELTAEEAAKRVQQVAAIPENRKLTWQSLGSSYQNSSQKVWSLAWEDASASAYSAFSGRTYAEVNAITGEVLQFQAEQNSFQLNDKTEESTAAAGSKKLSQAEAKQQALKLISSLYDQAGNRLKLAEHGGTWSVLPDSGGYRYEFLSYFDGIPVSNNTISLELDSYGKLRTYINYSYFDEAKLSKVASPAVSEAAALQKYKDLYTLELQYSQIGGYYSTGVYTDPKVKLVYTPVPKDTSKPYEVLDAQTGSWVSVYEASGSVAASASAADVKGHAQEKQLTELLKYGVITPDDNGKVSPDQEITVGDWLTYVAKAATPYYSQYYMTADKQAVAGVSADSPYYDAVSFAVSRGWLDAGASVQPEKKLNREELAVLLSSLLKYSKLASFLDTDSTVTGFSDNAAITSKGAVALVVRLGLLQGEGGKFNPQQIVTKAQAAAVIMKLVELQGKTDQPIGMQ